MSATSIRPSASVPIIAPYVGAVDWADTCAHLAGSWFELQYAMWQPLLDAQAEYMRRWGEQSGWPMSEVFPLRGAEQLA